MPRLGALTVGVAHRVGLAAVGRVHRYARADTSADKSVDKTQRFRPTRRIHTDMRKSHAGYRYGNADPGRRASDLAWARLVSRF